MKLPHWVEKDIEGLRIVSSGDGKSQPGSNQCAHCERVHPRLIKPDLA